MSKDLGSILSSLAQMGGSSGNNLLGKGFPDSGTDMFRAMSNPLFQDKDGNYSNSSGTIKISQSPEDIIEGLAHTADFRHMYGEDIKDPKFNSGTVPFGNDFAANLKDHFFRLAMSGWGIGK